MDDAPILICYDGSAGSLHAIAVAADVLASRRAVVLNVGPFLSVAESYAPEGLQVADLDRLVFEEALTRAEAGAEVARAAGFQAEARADVEAPTWRGVLEIADDIDAAVIVVGSSGLTGIHALLEENVSGDVSEHAGRPVLIVPRPR